MKTITLIAAFALLCNTAYCQNIYNYQQRHNNWYLQQAAETLPALYKKGAFDSIQSYINNKGPYINLPFVFATKILLQLQQNTFNIAALSNYRFVDSLQYYAQMVRLSQASTPPVSNQPGNSLEDIPYEDRLFLFDAVWARLLKETKQLDSTQQLICDIIAGKIANPSAAIRQKRKIYPALDSLVRQQALAARASFCGNMAYSAGVWLPMGNAANLGAHPTFGLLLGGRNKWHEINFNTTLRFGSTPHDYTVLRNDSLYNRHFYASAYGGLEYTRFFYRSYRFEAGVIAGAGYDAFDIANDNNDHSNDYLKPLEIGSLNLNAGLRLNYYLSTRNYLGLEAKFNNVHYNNNGGTPVNGNAFSFTVFIGRI